MEYHGMGSLRRISAAPVAERRPRDFIGPARDGRVFWPAPGPFLPPGGRARTPPTHIRPNFRLFIGGCA